MKIKKGKAGKPRVEKDKVSKLKLSDFELPLASEESFLESSLVYHIVHPEGGKGVAKDWKILNKKKDYLKLPLDDGNTSGWVVQSWVDARD